MNYNTMARPKNIYSFTSVTPSRVSIHSLPFYVGILLVLLFSSLYGIVYLVDGILPVPLTVKDEVSLVFCLISKDICLVLFYFIGPRNLTFLSIPQRVLKFLVSHF